MEFIAWLAGGISAGTVAILAASSGRRWLAILFGITGFFMFSIGAFNA